MTTKAEISEWFDAGVAKSATHILVVCDTFDYEDYPVYATGAKDTLTRHTEYSNKSMQKVMEVYDLHAFLTNKIMAGLGGFEPPNARVKV